MKIKTGENKMNSEIKRILKMVEEGKISSDQAEELIDALGNNEPGTSETSKIEKNLKVLVASRRGDSMNFKIPLKFAKNALKATGKLPFKIDAGDEIDIRPVIEAIENEIPGKIYELKSRKGDFIEMVIE
jgi:hypothetical protein